MIRYVVFALLLVAVHAGYPRYEEVVRDPRDFDLLYSSTSGPMNETWYFSAAVNLTSLIVPSQIFNFWSSGSWTSGTYKEEIDINLYETTLSSFAANRKTYLVATGSFNGTVKFGQELEIPLRNSTVREGQPVQRFINYNNGYTYTVNIVFRKTGIYPWYTSRLLTTYSCVHSSTNVAGIAIGLSFSP